MNNYHSHYRSKPFRMTMVKMGEVNSSSIYTTRLMLIVIAVLSKFAARYQSLSSRVFLCLAKILKQKQYFDKTITNRVNEYIATPRSE